MDKIVTEKRCPMCGSALSHARKDRCINADCGNWEGP